MSEIFRALVYLLCLGTAGTCAFLLWRSFRQSGARLLLWTGLCFGFLALNALAVILDMFIIQSISLQMPRLLLSLAAVGVLVGGLIWDMEEWS
ncbi:DUF5985 family protein [Allosphingosinicella vermicomposti]|uniref:DUF5985 family protein n=1 Tax=Allosphingosinicella vermicomposti TaxID=614671 RepID=UPI0018F89607|nr:DUF5985 family protein [Allosphingosinicella vermicomposti]